MSKTTPGTPQSTEPPPEPQNRGEAIHKKRANKFLGLLTFLANLLTRFLRLARYAYLLRVPIIIGVILFFFPFAALLAGSPMRALFQNLFLMDSDGGIFPWPTFWSTIAALAVAWSVLLTSRIVLLNCGDRFNVSSWMTAAGLRGWHFFGILVLALPTILGQFSQQDDFRPNQGACIECVVAVVAATLCSYILAFAALWFAVVLAPPRTQGSTLSFPCFKFMHDWLIWADNHHVLPKGLALGIWIRKNMPYSLWGGYLAPDGFIWSGHWLALLFGLVTLGLYLFIDWWHGRSLGEVSGITALTFLLLLLLNTNWVFSSMAFFLDHFRIPVVIPLALFALISGNLRNSDHYFQVNSQAADIKAPSPGEVLRAHAGKSIVVVATAGGGIQAAAWTTQVLVGLEALYQQWYPGESFAENVTLISAVSGGATGSMFYLNLYDPDPARQHHFRTEELGSLNDLVSKSSLDDVAWALLYRDLPHIFFPISDQFHDRGYALEETWCKRAHLNSSLSEWRKGVKEGWRPAIVFNSTIAETGEPLTFSTTAWQTELDPETNEKASPRRRNFYDEDLYQGQDLRVVTAVRLAATFPYVTPAARPGTAKLDDYHLIDGAYYDNYGISSLIAWLDEGLHDLQDECDRKGSDAKRRQACQKNALPRILVLQIRSLPATAEILPTKRGWAFQLYAPFKGLFSVTTTQLIRDREALAMFARRWEPAEAGSLQAKIHFATFEFGGFQQRERDKAISPPISWAMNPSQVQAVKDDWNVRVQEFDSHQNDPNVDKVHCFFSPDFGRCRKLSQKPQ